MGPFHMLAPLGVVRSAFGPTCEHLLVDRRPTLARVRVTFFGLGKVVDFDIAGGATEFGAHPEIGHVCVGDTA